MSRVQETTVTIDISEDTKKSQAIDVGDWLVSGIILPSALTSTALYFEGASTESGTYRDLYNASGTRVSATVAADRHILFEPQTFAGVRWLKLEFGSAEAADREVTLVLHQREG